ncbi:MAG: hypothetical protein ACI87W_001857 [Halieaceae bacterium]|jgi:hypothetical protein
MKSPTKPWPFALLLACALAISTLAAAGKEGPLLRSAGTPGVWLRVVDVDVPQPHETMTTAGWSVIELLVEDPDAVYQHLLDSPFRPIGGPANLGVVAKALGLPDDHMTPLGRAIGAESFNAIEIDGYPAQAKSRPVAPGQLPPAYAMASFPVKSLDDPDIEFIQPPAVLYGGRRAAAFVGPAGELIELIETGAGNST